MVRQCFYFFQLAVLLTDLKGEQKEKLEVRYGNEREALFLNSPE
jgi:hypothetical protein